MNRTVRTRITHAVLGLSLVGGLAIASAEPSSAQPINTCPNSISGLVPPTAACPARPTGFRLTVQPRVDLAVPAPTYAKRRGPWTVPFRNSCSHSLSPRLRSC